MSIYYVYVYLREHSSANGEAGTPYYIGKGKRYRIYHPHSNCGAKPPKDKRYILKIFNDLSNEEACALEIALIKIFGRLDLGTGYLRNRTNGGQGISGWKHSDETKQKMSKSNTGKIRSSQCRKHLSDIKKGKKPLATTKGMKFSEETRKKMSDSKTGQKRSAITKKRISDGKVGRKNPMFGKTHSDEYKSKLRANFTGENNPNSKRNRALRFKNLASK
jgi:hypothetical protein